jgi:Translation initiation factor IF-2, N-terminal region
LVTEGDIAGDYLEEFLDLMDFDGDIDLDVQGGRAIVEIHGNDDLNNLIGGKGEVLNALEELTRLAVYQKTRVPSRVVLDIGGWRRRDGGTLAGGQSASRRRPPASIAKPRVHELAKELGLKPKDVFGWLIEHGVFVKSASSRVDSDTALKVREFLRH